MSRTRGSLRGVPTPLPQIWFLPLDGVSSAVLSPEEEQWCGALPKTLQPRYRSSRSQLRHCVAGVLGCGAERVALHSPPAQAPRLLEGQGYVSISHSGDRLLLAWSPAPIGVDLERSDRPVQAELLARRFFPRQEVQALMGLPLAQRTGRVLESWVRKEAAIKWRGSSLASDLRHWCWNHEHQELSHLQQGWKPACALHLRDGWCCAAVGDGVLSAQWR